MKLLTIAVLSLSLFGCEKKNTQPSDYHQTAKTKFIEANGVNYAYRELGNQSGTPVLMISPLGSNMDDWDPAITNGLAAKYKVILFDLPGEGASSGTTPNNIADMASSVTTFIHALGLQKVNILGFSLGSFITQQIALTTPAVINKMILTGTGPKGAVGLSNLPSLLAAGANLTAEENFLRFGFTTSEASLAKGKAAWQRIQARVLDRDAAVSQASATAQVTAVLGWAQPYANAAAELKTINLPVLIIQGKEDVPVPVGNAEFMAENMPDAQLVVYPDAAHAALFQYPTEFVQSVITFIEQ
ncbi:alpha/beta hydrolase [Chitinophaga sp.]|uniref:alpha/beta fold hydrolase n=1 Tax=Chitinophaga sp. TaxID=1869181 RepID=UPI0031DE9523